MKAPRTSHLWAAHAAAGLVILALLGTHMTVMHLTGIAGAGNPSGGRPVDWANVFARAKEAAWLVSYVLLLGAALFHGLFGLRGVLVELLPAEGARRSLTATLAVLGLGLFGFGAWAAWASLRMAGGF